MKMFCLEHYIVHKIQKLYNYNEISFMCLSYLKLSRNVDHGKTLTLCPIILILCKVGCRLNMMTSLSTMCLST